MINTFDEEKELSHAPSKEGDFNYHSLNAYLDPDDFNCAIKIQNYQVSYGFDFNDEHRKDDGWLYFKQILKNEKTDLIQKKHIRSTSNYVAGGYKLHININDDPNSDKNNLPKAWAIIYPLLMKYGVSYSKIIANYARESLYSDPTQYAKLITIYCYYQKIFDLPLDVEIPRKLEEDKKLSYFWECLMREVTLALVEANIEPIELPISLDRKDFPIKGCSYFSYRNDIEQSNNLTNIFNCIDLQDITQPPRKKWGGNPQKVRNDTNNNSGGLSCKLC